MNFTQLPTTYYSFNQLTIPNSIPNQWKSTMDPPLSIPPKIKYVPNFNYSNFCGTTNKLSSHEQPFLIKSKKNKESFFKSLGSFLNPKPENPENKSERGEFNNMYLNALKGRASGIVMYLTSNKNYSAWSFNWKMLSKNLNKSSYLFQALNESDADIAFVVDKGDEIKFKLYSDNKYASLGMYQYVLYHEMAHMANPEIGHGQKFRELLSLICVAAFEMGFLQFEKIRDDYKMQGTQLTNKRSMLEELEEGISLLRKENLNKLSFYDKLLDKVRRDYKK
jgi:hypothetical protein